ncbi:hypothetical protein BGZ60DRAFT_529752 [Tricladium varicosporioides]|nr:hypothetical protein BGZ60DRAFT_529752 [Hymenoscyphus varicosporioides]
MDSLTSIPGVDMNIPNSLKWYTVLLTFKNDLSASGVCFTGQSNEEQRNIQTIAHALQLDYEYSKANRTITITQSLLPPSLYPAPSPLLGGLEGFDLKKLDCLPDCPLDQCDDSGALLGLDLNEMPLGGNQDNPSPPDMGSGNQGYDVVPMIKYPMDQYSASIDLFTSSRPPTATSADLDQGLLDSNKLTQNDFKNTQNNAIFMPATDESWSCLLGQPQCVENNLSFAEFSPTSGPPWKENFGIADPIPGVLYGRPSTIVSTATSIKSNQSDRGRNRVRKKSSRSSSIGSKASTTFHEGVFDSKTGRSSSMTSRTSGRQGPLDAVARAAANAVKAAKACWRCKILRKQCDLDTPCNSCPRSLHSAWYYVGCRREDLTMGISIFSVCPNRATSSLEKTAELNLEYIDFSDSVSLQNRENDLRIIKDHIGTHNMLLTKTLGSAGEKALSLLRECEFWTKLKANPGTWDCILEIVWEISGCSKPQIDAITACQPLTTLTALLQSASLHQQATRSTWQSELITRSLDCLRSSLELLRMGDIATQIAFSHDYCGAGPCLVESQSNIQMRLNTFVDCFARAMFRKENTHNKSWWFPVFYSLCIHGCVRQVLLVYFKSYQPPGSQPQDNDAFEYLQVAVRLFIACSGMYDPLRSQRTLAVQNISAAEKTILKEVREIMGVNSTAEYLSEIYDL